MNMPDYAARHPVVAIRHLCSVASDYGISATEMLVGTQLTAATIADPDAKVTTWDEIAVARNALARVPDPAAMGFATGTRFNLANLGLLGFALMACPTIRELIATTLRFFTLTMLQSAIRIQERPTVYRLTIDADHLPTDVQTFFIARDIAAIASTVAPFLSATLGKHADQIRVEFGLDNDQLRSVVALLPLTHVAFGRPASFADLPLDILDEPLPQADEHTMRLCIAQCEDLVARLNTVQGIESQIRMLLVADPANMPTLECAADLLNVHPRSLRRQLAAEGTSWRAVTNNVRATLAAELLSQVGMTVEGVASRLGYSETAAFTHAFTRWFGVPPSRYRAVHR